MRQSKSESSQGGRARTLDQSHLESLVQWLGGVLGADQVRIEQMALLGGGAVQENWRIDAAVSGGAYDGANRWVLRTDAVARLVVSLDRTAEFGVISAAHGAGVKVAPPLARCDDPEVIGAPFLVQGFVEGEAQARRLTRDEGLAQWGQDVAFQLGVELAKIHRIAAGAAELSFLPQPMISPALAEVAKFRAALDTAGEPRPALEYALAWLHENDPGSDGLCLVHGDFRTGNFLVSDWKLSAILDWEFAHWGDPYEDIGWFSAKCWRFGNDHLTAGGIGSLEAFEGGYQSVLPCRFDLRKIAYWQVMAAAKWATIAVLQGDRYRLGGETSIELALTGLMPSELELEALDGIKALEALRLQ